MNTDFEAFRRERKIRRQQTRVTERPAGHSDVWEEIEAREATEMQEEILNAECDAFFTDATRLAASIVQRVSKDREQQVSSKLLREMEEFLRESIRHATKMVHGIDWQKPHHAEETFEPSLRNILGRELDAFRAEGTAQLSDKHFGQDPFGEQRPPEPTPEKSVPESARRPRRQLDVLPAPDELDLRESASEPTAPVAPTTAVAPIEPQRIDLHVEPPGEMRVEITERRIRLSEQELSVDFQSTRVSASFQADEFDARVPDVAPIQTQLPSPGASDDDLPLAATVMTDGTPVIDVEVVEALMGEVEPAVAAQPAPQVDVDVDVDVEVEPVESVAADEAIREALRTLVKQGIMTPEQARAAYRRQTA